MSLDLSQLIYGGDVEGDNDDHNDDNNDSNDYNNEYSHLYETPQIKTEEYGYETSRIHHSSSTPPLDSYEEGNATQHDHHHDESDIATAVREMINNTHHDELMRQSITGKKKRGRAAKARSSTTKKPSARKKRKTNSASAAPQRDATDADSSDQPVEEEDVTDIAGSMLEALYTSLSTNSTNSTTMTAVNPIRTAAAGTASKVISNHNTTMESLPFRNPILYGKLSQGPDKNNEKKKSAVVDVTEDEKDTTNEESTKAEMKKLRKARGEEWIGMERRWKKRTVDYREEIDVGNAYANRAKWVLQRKKLFRASKEKRQQQKKQTREQRQQQKQKNIETGEQQGPSSGRNENNDIQVRFSSDEEEGNIFERLTGSQPQDYNGGEKEALNADDIKKKMQEKTLQQLRQPYSERLDYWERGQIAPRVQELNFFYNSKDAWKLKTTDPAFNAKIPTAEASAIALNKTRIARSPTTSLPESQQSTPYCITKNYDANATAIHPNTFFQMPLHNGVFSPVRFLHERQLLRLAARYIAGNAGRRRHSIGRREEDRLLRAIWNRVENVKVDRLLLLLTQTEHHGMNMEAFLSHVWKNDRARTLVAKSLGICGQSSYEEWRGPPRMAGYTLNMRNVRLQSRQQRQRLLKNYRLTLRGHPLKVPKMYPYKGKTNRSMLDLSLQERIEPSVGYIHVPGTAPPTPSFPLDESNLLFGPSDRHVSFHHNGSVDETRYKLTLSSLMNRLAEMHSDQSDCEYRDYEAQTAHAREMQSIQKQLQVFVEKSPLCARSNSYKYFQAELADLPQVQYYRTLMSFCSFAASGCPQPTKAITTVADNGDSTVDGEQSMADVEPSSSVLTMDEAASKIYGFLEYHINNSSGLRAFPRLYIIFGLAGIARMLPPSAAKILSSPVDDRHYRTPFDLFRHVLEYLEEEDMLQETEIAPVWSNPDGAIVVVGELEYALYRAAQVFSASIKEYPLEVSYHEWHLAALSASLLLCSGNKVGSKALPFPSSYYDNPNDMFSNDDGEEYRAVDDSVRRTLPKFEETLSSAKRALKLLTQLCGHQQGSSRGHLAVSSFLEWKQVVALVLGRDSQSKSRVKQLRRFHHHHALQWAFQERSASAMRYLDAVNLNSVAPTDAKIKQFAVEIENDPDDIKNWRALTNALGPIGISATIIDSLRCDPNTCGECMFLRNGFVIDHNNLEARKSSGTWWGAGIVSWWYPHFLSLPRKAPTLKEIQATESAIGDLRDDLEMMNVSGDSEQCRFTPPPPDISWLWNRKRGASDSFDGLQSSALEDTSGRHIDDVLPKSIDEMMLSDSGVSDDNQKNDSEDLGPDVEPVYLKLIITCHLFGVSHPAVEDLIVLLAQSCASNESQKIAECSEFRCLQSLSCLGLDILKIIESCRKKAAKAEPVKSRYSLAQREAVRDGVNELGYYRWTEIGRRYEALHGLGRHAIAVRLVGSRCYTFLFCMYSSSTRPDQRSFNNAENI